jgi:hypothetical protein
MELQKDFQYTLRCTKREKHGARCAIEDTSYGCWVPKSRMSLADWHNLRVGDTLWAFLYKDTMKEIWIRARECRRAPNQDGHRRRRCPPKKFKA